jgi:DNA-binding cell septation regulator SpoVG
MEVKVQWIDGTYPSFNVMISSKEGMDPFITIKNCNIKTGPKGEFISYPSKKTNEGKYFNYIFASEKFNGVVMEKAKLAKPERSIDEPTRKSSMADMADDIPF